MNLAWPVVQIETERRRLEVLRYLSDVPGYEAAGLILMEHCRSIGVPSSSDQTTSCLAWLEEQALVTLRSVRDEPIARLTRAGRETATGIRRHPGVMKPEP